MEELGVVCLDPRALELKNLPITLTTSRCMRSKLTVSENGGTQEADVSRFRFLVARNRALPASNTDDDADVRDRNMELTSASRTELLPALCPPTTAI